MTVKVDNVMLKENKLAVMPVGKLLLVMALPMVVSQMVKALYNTVDSYFVSGLGIDEMSAITLAYSVQAILNAFAMGLGIGLNSAISRCLGAGEQDRAKRVLGNGLMCAVIIVIVAMCFGVFGCSWYYTQMNATSAVLEFGCSYLRICMLWSAGLVFSAAMESLLQATGHSVSSMLVQGTCFLSNIILDPFLIFGWFGFPELGIAGAAIATVIAQFIGVALALFLNLRFNRWLFPSFWHIVPEKTVLHDILKVGFPSMMLNMLVPVMTLGMNKILMPHSSEYVALFGIYFRVQLFFFLPLFGVNNGMIPIISFNTGARNQTRVKKAIQCGIRLVLVISAVGIGCFQVFGSQLLTLFHATENMLNLGVRAFRIISVTFPLAAVSICLSGVFQGLGNGMFGLIINILRQIVVVLIAWGIVSSFGIYHIWFAYWGSEFLASMFCLFYGKKHLPKLIGG